MFRICKLIMTRVINKDTLLSPTCGLKISVLIGIDIESLLKHLGVRQEKWWPKQGRAEQPFTETWPAPSLKMTTWPPPRDEWGPLWEDIPPTPPSIFPLSLRAYIRMHQWVVISHRYIAPTAPTGWVWACKQVNFRQISGACPALTPNIAS